MDIYKELTSIFRTVFDDSELELRPEMIAPDIDGWDSLSNMVLMLAIETHFNIKISLGEQRLLRNVGDIAACIENKRP